jgi:hypothetical protein
MSGPDRALLQAIFYLHATHRWQAKNSGVLQKPNDLFAKWLKSYCGIGIPALPTSPRGWAWDGAGKWGQAEQLIKNPEAHRIWR